MRNSRSSSATDWPRTRGWTAVNARSVPPIVTSQPYSRADSYCTHSHLQLEEARAKIARLETELAHLPAVYASRARLELERASSENEQLVVQARTLARRLSEAEEDKRMLSSSSLAAAAPQADSVLQLLTTTSVVNRRSPPAGGPAGEQHDFAAGAHGAELETKRGARNSTAGGEREDADHDSADQRAFDTDGLNKGKGLDRLGAVDEEGSETTADRVDFLRRENQALKIDKSSLEQRVSSIFPGSAAAAKLELSAHTCVLRLSAPT